MATTTKKLSVEVDTTEFEFSHGHAPRGRGSWAFLIGSDEPTWIPGSMTYGEAKKQAIAIARERKVHFISVCS